MENPAVVERELSEWKFQTGSEYYDRNRDGNVAERNPTNLLSFGELESIFGLN